MAFLVSQIAPSGELEGFDIDIAKALCDQLKAQCTLVEQEWDGMIPALNVRKLDAIVASMTISEERKKSGGLHRALFRRAIALRGQNR